METAPRKSRAWIFIAATIVLLVILLFNGFTLIGQNNVQTPDTIPANALTTFFIAALALLTAVASNVSAFLNHTSQKPTRIVGPIVMAMTFIIVIPLFISLGLTMIS